MASIINTNVMSLNAQRNLSTSQNSLNTSIERLSSGLRINSAKDDAAGLSISERMGSQIRGMNQAVRNANDGISLSQTAEGALTEVGNNLQRIRELAVQSSNASNTQVDRDAIQFEVAQLLQEIDRVADQSAFNGVNLIDGSFSGAVFQVGANAGENITVSSIVDANTAALGSVSVATDSEFASAMTGFATTIAAGGITLDGGTGAVDLGAIGAAGSALERAGQMVNAINAVSTQTNAGATYNASTGEIIVTSTAQVTWAGTVDDATVTGFANGTGGAVATTTGITTLNVSSYSGAQLAIQQADSALATVNTSRAELGALQNRFASTVANLETASENLSAARSRIRDADFAAETANMTRAQILQQAGVAMVSQANAIPQSVLSLLQ